MTDLSTDFILQIMHSIKPLGKPDNANFTKQGRERDYDELNFLRVFILMMLIDIPTIKGIWKFLNLNQNVSEACGFTKLPDRSTFSRRLNKLDIKKWI